MLFNSFEYLLFFPLIVAIYYSLPHKTRWFALLAASYYFYGSWNATYLLLIATSTFISYFAAREIAKTRRKDKRRFYLWISVLANMGPLLVFKYFDFFNESLVDIANLIGWNYPIEALGLLLPVGISFFTFQTLSYTIDVYNKKVKPENHLGIFALYVSFFPQLVAGPIERPGNLIPQLKKKGRLIHNNLRDGLTMIAWGLFKKVVIADRLAVGVNEVFNNAQDHSGLALVVATIFFAFQIYGDFSGYSDIAIGSAKVMGIDLMRNFDRPYFSKSISEFWRRWHISLSTWFRDYVYIPLGGNRVVKWRWYYNLFITFFLSGLWHGAAWTFVIWGALHGVYLIIGSLTRNSRDKALNTLKISKKGWLYKLAAALTVFILVNIGWVLFRANSMGDAWHILSSLHIDLVSDIMNFEFRQFAKSIGMLRQELLIGVVGVVLLIFSHFFSRGGKQPIEKIGKLPIYIRWPVYYALIMAIVFFGVFDSSEFIYFQF